VPCQRLFPGGVYSTYHAVRAADSDIANVSLPCSGSGDNVTDRLDRELDRLESLEAADARLRSTGVSPSRQSSPWLDVTRWRSFFGDTCLHEAPSLVTLPVLLDSTSADPYTDEVLNTILTSFDRLILFAREAIERDRVNLFDQYRVNSFIPK